MGSVDCIHWAQTLRHGPVPSRSVRASTLLHYPAQKDFAPHRRSVHAVASLK